MSQEPEAGSSTPLTIKERLGIALVVLSFLLFWSMLALPFIGDVGVHKGWVAGGLAVAAEVVFWLGVMVAGRDFMRRYRDRLSIRKLIAWLKDETVEDKTARPSEPSIDSGANPTSAPKDRSETP